MSKTDGGRKRHCGSGNVESLNAEKKTLMRYTFTLSICSVLGSMLNLRNMRLRKSKCAL